MTFEHFQARAEEIFQSIPPEFREGVDGLIVEPGVQPHPELPEIFTLGECRTETYPSEYGGPGTVRSFVVLFHGSFREVAARDAEWDWEEELFETITHEVKHHLESLASEDALEVEDWVMDQNFARRDGSPFAALFHRDGIALEEGGWEVDGDLFLEREIDAAELQAGAVEVEVEGYTFRVPLPDPLADVHYLVLDGIFDEGGDVVLVLIRKRGVWESLRAALSGGGGGVAHGYVTPTEIG